jgi:hypothetical protein
MHSVKAATSQSSYQAGCKATHPCSSKHLFQDVAQHGQHKCRRLSRTSLGHTNDIALLHAQRDGSHLDGAGLGVANGLDGLQPQGRLKAHVMATSGRPGRLRALSRQRANVASQHHAPCPCESCRSSSSKGNNLPCLVHAQRSRGCSCVSSNRGMREAGARASMGAPKHPRNRRHHAPWTTGRRPSPSPTASRSCKDGGPVRLRRMCQHAGGTEWDRRQGGEGQRVPHRLPACLPAGRRAASDKIKFFIGILAAGGWVVD